MRIQILSRGATYYYTTRRLVDACFMENVDAVISDPVELALLLPAGDRPTVLHRGHALEDVDAVIPRIGVSITEYGVAVLHHFEMLGVPTVNPSTAIYRARDKLRSLQILASHGVPVPPTLMTREPGAIRHCIERLGGPPVILKLLQGTQGVGVMLAESLSAAESILEAMWGLGQDILVQKFIQESRGSDTRLLVVGNRVVAGMRRIAPAGAFRSNLHRGGRGVEVDPVPERMQKVALKAARALGLRIAGVDLLESKEGPLVAEVNVSPGLEGIEAVSGRDLAREMIRFAKRFAAAKGRGRRRKA